MRSTPTIGLAPGLTVAAIHGGESYSIVPDECAIDLDVRLTPSFNSTAVQSLVDDVVQRVNEQYPTGKSTTITVGESWPAYCLAEMAPIRFALTRAAARHLIAARFGTLFAET